MIIEIKMSSGTLSVTPGDSKQVLGTRRLSLLLASLCCLDVATSICKARVIPLQGATSPLPGCYERGSDKELYFFYDMSPYAFVDKQCRIFA
ncbi:hypothetical protein [Undibacterium sp. SXout7W]|uniref:hypothetical protein n=1 Tax=Undibacterium sp. SXout7W TaxID=3413049 RepID=UPI003BF48132